MKQMKKRNATGRKSGRDEQIKFYIKSKNIIESKRRESERNRRIRREIQIGGKKKQSLARRSDVDELGNLSGADVTGAGPPLRPRRPDKQVIRATCRRGGGGEGGGCKESGFGEGVFLSFQSRTRKRIIVGRRKRENNSCMRMKCDSVLWTKSNQETDAQNGKAVTRITNEGKQEEVWRKWKNREKTFNKKRYVVAWKYKLSTSVLRRHKRVCDIKRETEKKEKVESDG